MNWWGKSIDEESWLMKKADPWRKLIDKKSWLTKKVDCQRKSIEEESWLMKKVVWQIWVLMTYIFYICTDEQLVVKLVLWLKIICIMWFVSFDTFAKYQKRTLWTFLATDSPFYMYKLHIFFCGKLGCKLMYK